MGGHLAQVGLRKLNGGWMSEELMDRDIQPTKTLPPILLRGSIHNR